MDVRLKHREIAFVATKPLQIMISMMVCDQLAATGGSHLMIVTSFAGAEAIVERIRLYDPRWLTVSSFPTRQHAIAECARMSYGRVFVDSDVGFKTGHYLRALRRANHHTRLCIYEEGVGTYSDNLYPRLRGSVVHALGGAVHFGGLRDTQEVWLFDPGTYAGRFPKHTHKVRPIVHGLHPWLLANEVLLETIFLGESLDDLIPQDSEENRCSLYLSSWGWDSEVADAVRASGGLCVVKLHPHITEDASEIVDLFDVEIPASVPAELLIVALARRFKDVTVFHHGSSVERYITLPQVTYIRVD